MLSKSRPFWAKPNAPYWLMPMPWPKPAPRTTMREAACAAGAVASSASSVSRRIRRIVVPNPFGA